VVEVKAAKDVRVPPVALSADGKTLAVGRYGKDGDQIGVFEVPGGKLRAAVKGGANFSLSPDGGTLVEWTASEAAGTVMSVWDTKAAKEPRVLKDDRWLAQAVAFLDGGKQLAVGVAKNVRDGRTIGVRVYGTKSLEPMQEFTFGKPAKDEPAPRLWATPDSAFLLTQTADHTLRLFRTPYTPKAADAPPKAKTP
jgi:WD40 repeat protein